MYNTFQKNSHYWLSDLLEDVVDAIADEGCTRIPAMVEITEVEVVRYTYTPSWDDRYDEYTYDLDVEVIDTYRLG